MGLFGASARLRDKSLASPEQYQPMFSPTVPESRPMDENITFPSDLGAAMNIPRIKQGGGAFGRGGVGWSILGAIGDGLSQMGGYGAPFAQARNLQRQQELEEAQWTRRQNSELQRQIAVKQWERDHPAPFNNDTVNDYNFRVQTLGKQAADEWLRSQGDPIVTIPLPGDRIYSGPRSGLGAALGGAVSAPTPQAGAIVDDPRKAGGAAPSGQRRFP